MQPWYKHSLVWLVIGLPVLSIVGCTLTIWLAYQNPDKVISPDISRKGMFYKDQRE